MQPYKLSIKDRKILGELDRNSRQSLAEIAKHTNLSKDVVNYRLNNLLKAGVIEEFNTHVNLAKTGYFYHKLYLQFQNLTEKKEKEIIDYFISHERVNWFASCSGRWDMIIGFMVKSIIEFDRIILDITGKFGDYILSKDISAPVKTYDCGRILFLQEKPFTPRDALLVGEANAVQLDKDDEELLRIVGNNARLPTVEIAKKSTLTPRQVSYKLKQLVDKNVINYFGVRLNLNVLGIQFYKLLIKFHNINYGKRQKFINHCTRIPQTIYIIVCAGSWDIEPEFEVNSHEELEAIVKDLRGKFSDIIRTIEIVRIVKEHKFIYFPAVYKAIK